MNIVKRILLTHGLNDLFVDNLFINFKKNIRIENYFKIKIFYCINILVGQQYGKTGLICRKIYLRKLNCSIN